MTIRAAFRTAKLTEPEIRDKWDAAFEALELLPKLNPERKNGNPQITYSKITNSENRKKKQQKDKFVMRNIGYVQEIKKGSVQCKLFRHEMRYKPMQNLNHFLLNMKFCGTSSCMPL